MGLVYSVVFFLVSRMFLLDVFVFYFEGIFIVKFVVELVGIFMGVDGIVMGVLGLLMGWVVRRFIFVFVVMVFEGMVGDEENERFDFVSVSLEEMVKWNLWGWRDKMKVLVVRMGVVVVVMVVGMYLDMVLGIRGVD